MISIWHDVRIIRGPFVWCVPAPRTVNQQPYHFADMTVDQALHSRIRIDINRKVGHTFRDLLTRRVAFFVFARSGVLV